MIGRLVSLIGRVFGFFALLFLIGFIAVILAGHSIEASAGSIAVELAPQFVEWLREFISVFFSVQAWEATVQFLRLQLWAVSLMIVIALWLISVIFSWLGKLIPF